MEMLPEIPERLSERGGTALQWESLRERLAAGAHSPLGRAWVMVLEPSADAAWIDAQQARNAEMRLLVVGGAPFDFHGVIDVSELLDKARIDGAALEAAEILNVLAHAQRATAWIELLAKPPEAIAGKWPAMEELSAPLTGQDLRGLLRALEGKIEADGTLSDGASPELARIRKALERQHRAIEKSLQRMLAKLAEEGSTQEELITVRGERFVIPVKAEYKRKVGGVIHGSSSSGQTIFVEPMETIELNNEMARLLDEEQAEVYRILVAMTRAIAANAEPLRVSAGILAEADAHQAIARFAQEMNCVRPVFGEQFDLVAARHPLLEMRLRQQGGEITPLNMTLRAFPTMTRQLIVSGPNTGGKTVVLKTAGLLALMAQAGVPVPAERAKLPLFTAVYADIGDAQSIEQNLSTFSSHVVNVNRIARAADEYSLVLLDELGSATDPEEGAALAVAVAEHFLEVRAWCLITTHLTSLKVYAAKHESVLNASVEFDEAALAPTYELRLGVPGASAGLNIAARLGLDPVIVANARAQMSTQQADIGHFLDELHAQLSAATAERETLAESAAALERERMRLEQQGRLEQRERTRELERRLAALIVDFEAQMRAAVKSMDDKTAAKKLARDSALRIAQMKREFSEQFQSTVAAHAVETEPTSTKQADRKREPQVGDVVRLKSLNREARVTRVIDGKSLEVAAGAMKMRVGRDDVAEVIAAVQSSETKKRSGGVTVPSGSDGSYASSEINVIGKTADEAEAEVDRFIEHAFLAGLTQVRVVHGVGMGILRRTLREFLRNHPHVTSVTEPPYNEGGQGATLVELRQ